MDLSGDNMGLDLYVGSSELTTGAWKLGIFAVLMFIVLMVVNSKGPRIIKGILSAAVMLGGIYLFALWLS